MSFFKSDNYLIISDAHIPYENEKALKFLHRVKTIFRVPDEHVYSVGDLLDLYNFSMHAKGPDGPHNAKLEIEAAREKIKLWSSYFPLMKICHANHESRYWRKASLAEIPSMVLKSIRDVFEYPEGWELKSQWIVNGSKEKFLIIHGEGFSGIKGHIDAALYNGMNTVIGHLHSCAGVNYIKTAGQKLWAMNVGCLIDPDAYAFEYGKHSKHKPTIGCGVVLNGGCAPMWIDLNTCNLL